MNPSIVVQQPLRKSERAYCLGWVEDEQVAGARDEVPKYRGEKFVLQYRK